jgi:SAM-dependent methyltransferase
MTGAPGDARNASGVGFEVALFERSLRARAEALLVPRSQPTDRLGPPAALPDEREHAGDRLRNGFVLEAIRSAFPRLRLVGSELFPEGLDYARRRLHDVELLQLDARALPFENAFDVVGAFGVLEHIEEDERVLGEMRRAARRGIVLLVPQHPRLWSDADTIGHHVRR